MQALLRSTEKLRRVLCLNAKNDLSPSNLDREVIEEKLPTDRRTFYWSIGVRSSERLAFFWIEVPATQEFQTEIMKNKFATKKCRHLITLELKEIKTLKLHVNFRSGQKCGLTIGALQRAFGEPLADRFSGRAAWITSLVTSGIILN